MFGTVWGIMSSFSGIAESRDTSVAVFAPVIAEALAGTAFGLGAAIAAAIAYIHFGATFYFLASEIDMVTREKSTALTPHPVTSPTSGVAVKS